VRVRPTTLSMLVLTDVRHSLSEVTDSLACIFLETKGLKIDKFMIRFAVDPAPLLPPALVLVFAFSKTEI